ncbi:MAG: hypothetical protein HY587_08645 [Candidatus Omnitrophica bacterium]|nr:hypothetical protein [Candidatus Omnitrophota bacterium]
MRDVRIEHEARSFAWALLFMVFWTVMLKYAAPVIWALRNGVNPSELIMWDAWPAAHLAVVILLLKGKKAAWRAAFLVAIPELVIIIWKLRMYFLSFDTNLWKVNWAINKTVLLAYFFFLLIWLLKPGVRKAYAGEAVQNG